MTDRRTYAFAQPALTRGEERPAPACAGRPEAFDYLIDYKGGDGHTFALHQARELCGVQHDGTIRRDPAQRCPRVMDCLLRDNRDEDWTRVILGLPAVDKTPAHLSTAAQSARAKGKHAANNAARLTDLRAMMAAGATLDEVCERLSLTKSGLWKWCRDHAPDLWPVLSPPRKAVVSRPKRRAA